MRGHTGANGDSGVPSERGFHDSATAASAAGSGDLIHRDDRVLAADADACAPARGSRPAYDEPVAASLPAAEAAEVAHASPPDAAPPDVAAADAAPDRPMVAAGIAKRPLEISLNTT